MVATKLRGRALAAAALALLMLPEIARGGPAEVELLQSYVGSWRGSGVVTGGDAPERFNCRMTVSRGNSGKINYAGRCALAGMNLSVSGTIAYIDAAGRYEAAMTSNAGFTGLAVGQRTGGGVTFSLRERKQDEEEDMTITSRVTLSQGDIDVDFNVVFNDTGETLRASVPFSRS